MTVSQKRLAKFGFECQMPSELKQVEIRPGSDLIEIYSHLGRSRKLGLSGRPNKRIGVLGTSKFYEIRNEELTIFYPEFTNIDELWIAADIHMLIDRVKTELNYLQSHWSHAGRPTIVIPISNELLNLATSAGNGSEVNSPIYKMMKKFQSGFSHGVRVNLGFLETFLSTSFVSKLLFKSEDPNWPQKNSGRKMKSTYLRKMPVRKVLKPTGFVNELVTNQKIDLTQVMGTNNIFLE